MDENIFSQPGQMPVDQFPVETKKRFNLKVWLPVVVIALLLAGGFLFKDYLRFYLFHVGTPPCGDFIPCNTTLPTSMTSPDPTSGWKIYTNSQYGFTFKYPAKVQDENVVLSESNTENFDDLSGFFHVFIRPRNWQDNFFIISISNSNSVEKFSSDERLSDTAEKNIVTIGKETGYEIVFLDVLAYYLPRGSYGFYTFYPHWDDPLLQAEWFQILSTFKFTDQKTSEGQFCGGIAGIACPAGYKCQYDGNYPDAGGVCVK